MALRSPTAAPIPVIDLFAGPGGLSEGFTAPVDGTERFRSVAAFEMDAAACDTLRLRAALRHLRSLYGTFPPDYYAFLRGERSWAEFRANPAVDEAFQATASEVHRVTLGETPPGVVDAAIRSALGREAARSWVLLGGPPCQAYSLAGRSRRANDETFADDVKHFLYREYLRIIEKFRPPVFVMENVKGLLSSTHGGTGMFERILGDLTAPGYEIRSFVRDGRDLRPRDFVIRAEDHGVPQRRHRVILLGVRRDADVGQHSVLARRSVRTVEDAICDMPPVRSLLSPRRTDDVMAWLRERERARALAGGGAVWPPAPTSNGRPLGGGRLGSLPHPDLSGWLRDPYLPSPTLHEARSHMPGDLRRYAYMAAVAAERGASPTLRDLPDELLPAHSNARRAVVPFADRFRVQVASAPATTVVSHISKDGHYFIHYDPAQMRSLTVREAARLQTFPDNYFFCGSRTEQYRQVGNAVPPLLAAQLAAAVHPLLAR